MWCCNTLGVRQGQHNCSLWCLIHMTYIIFNYFIAEKDVHTRWKTLKDSYQKLVKPPESGSSPKPLTDRNKYIIHKLSFLAGYGKTRTSVTSNLPANPNRNESTGQHENAGRTTGLNGNPENAVTNRENAPSGSYQTNEVSLFMSYYSQAEIHRILYNFERKSN